MAELRYYLGANSPMGFYGYFQKAYGKDWHVWLIKGGPGCGKSTLMRQIAEGCGGEWEYIHCSSDPKSLDAILCAEKKIMLADATAPHAMEAQRPGCVEQLLDLGAGFRTELLRKNTETIHRLFEQNAEMHRQAVRYLAAAAQVQTVRMEQARERMDTAAVREAADLWLERYGCGAKGCGREKWRGLCAVTPDGIRCFSDTVYQAAHTVYALQDDWGAAAALFMEHLRKGLLQKGHTIVTGRCSLFPQEKTEHLLLEEKKAAFVTSNQAHPFAGATCAEIGLQDVYGVHRPGTREALRRMLAQEEQLLNAASGCMYQARLIHDELEKYYIEAMDFTFAQSKAEEMICRLRQLPVVCA